HHHDAALVGAMVELPRQRPVVRDQQGGARDGEVRRLLTGKAHGLERVLGDLEPDAGLRAQRLAIHGGRRGIGFGHQHQGPRVAHDGSVWRARIESGERNAGLGPISTVIATRRLPAANGSFGSRRSWSAWPRTSAILFIESPCWTRMRRAAL